MWQPQGDAKALKKDASRKLVTQILLNKFGRYLRISLCSKQRLHDLFNFPIIYCKHNHLT